MIKKQIILIGGGGHCKACIDVIEQSGEFNISGILDKQEKVGNRILDAEIIGTDDDIPKLLKTINCFLITIGHIRTAARRKALFEMLISHEAEMPVIISPYAYVSDHANIGEGTIVMHHAIIAGARVGNNCIINSKALIEHDVIIGDHCHISTGAIINGGVKVGDETFFGSGAISVHETIIPAKSFIKANSLFIK
jgi:sugar O-acyltransferase (sialic acid O-acetyltransferase NeuD family)